MALVLSSISSFYLEAEGVIGFIMDARASERGPSLLEGITRTFVFFFLEESELEGDLTWRGCSKPLPRDL